MDNPPNFLTPSPMNPMTIGCRALRVSCVIGVYPHERTIYQELLVDCHAILPLDFTQWEDAIDSTISYTLIAESITKTLQKGCFKLLETAAYTVVQTLLADNPRFLEVSIRIEKQALSQAAAAYVCYTQQRCTASGMRQT